MKKKQYEKPSMKVVELQHRTMLLAGSGERDIPGYDDDYSYMPGLEKDDINHLA